MEQRILREELDREGYIIVRNVVDKKLIEEASKHIEWLLKRNPGIRPEQLHHPLIWLDPFWVRLISDNRLLDVAEQLIGPNICLFSSHYICKPARTGLPVLWHQDGSYFPLEQTDPSVPLGPVNIWLAVDPSVPENGCLRVIPGSHKIALQKLNERKDVENVLNTEIACEVDDSKAVDIILQPGDISIHHANIIHGSKANNSDMRRCGLTIRYIPTTTRLKDATLNNNLFLLRGKPVTGVNVYRPWPRFIKGKHLEFAGSSDWNEYKKSRQFVTTEFTEDEEREIENLGQAELKVMCGDPAAKKIN
eukprot:TRINITY_DN1_c0_g1_i2.p1 TRINITY_DN1_c0_g1~~TRINITY_DN1_c0_g1_i2.p1  ORF type:complete len:325 (-),score=61.39 TRINITY_DN1_c0_g1_i2:816-1733(-)